MSPDELAVRHPRLYHVAAPNAWASIERHGLLPTSDLLTLFEVPDEARPAIERQRRAMGVRLEHPMHGEAEITDNGPLNLATLARRLDDGLTSIDWLSLLNSRVFFWADASGRDALLNARANRGRPKLVLEIDTLGLITRYSDRTEVSAINTGSTLRGGPRRGTQTFTPLGRYDYATWRSLRGKRDRIREVTLVGGSVQVAPFLLARYITVGAEISSVSNSA